jgi:hypothetical protein
MRNHLPQARFVCLWDFANRAPLTEVNVHHTPAGTHITFWRGDRVTHVTLYDDPGNDLMRSFRSRKAASDRNGDLLVFILKARHNPIPGMRGAQFIRH